MMEGVEGQARTRPRRDVHLWPRPEGRRRGMLAALTPQRREDARLCAAVLLLALWPVVHAAKTRGWLDAEQLVRGDAPLARKAYGIAVVDDLTIIFGGDVLGSMC